MGPATVVGKGVVTQVGLSCVDLTGKEPDTAWVHGPEYLILYATPNCTMPAGTRCVVVKPGLGAADLSVSKGGVKSARLLHVHP
jgi:hypothetical protein